MQICTLPAGESGYSDLVESAAWARPEDRRLLRKLTHHTVVMGHVPPVSQPEHGQAIRAIARVIAEACDGIVYDGWSHQVLPHDFRFGVEHPEFCLADDWLATFISASDAPDRPEGSDPARASHRAGSPNQTGGLRRADNHKYPDSPDRRSTSTATGADEPVRDCTSGGLHLVTSGMHRFAFPELEATTVPISNICAAMTLLRCLAVTLLAEHWDWLACNPGARSRRLPEHVRVEARDVWRYWAAEPKDAIAGRVEVRLECTGESGPDALPYLSVGPPADFGAPIAEWWNDVVDLAMPYVSEAPRRTAA